MVTAENITDIRVSRGTLTTCWDSYTRNGVVSTERLWLYLPDDGERLFVGLTADMTRAEAIGVAEAANAAILNARSSKTGGAL